MTANTQLTEGVERGYIIALLLAGNQTQAEVSVLTSIADLDPDHQSEAILVERIIRTTISQSLKTPSKASSELANGSCGMPIELQRVLQLPRHLRQCFVLRILVGLHRNECAHLLHLETHELDLRTCAAAVELAALRSCALHVEKEFTLFNERERR